jgi:hypothetical protein
LGELILFFRGDDMSKKFFFFGVAALLSVSLFVLGCSTDSDGGDNDNGGGPSPAVIAAAKALAASDDFTGKATASNGVVTLSAAVSLDNGDAVVPAGVTLVVGLDDEGDALTLTVPSGKTLTVAGTLSVSGSVVLGAATNAKVILQAGAVLSVAEDGGLFSGGSGDAPANVTITVAASDDATTATKATVSGSSPYWIITTTADTGASGVDIVLGELNLDFADDTAVDADACAASSEAAAGTLRAGTGTVITFGGSS